MRPIVQFIVGGALIAIAFRLERSRSGQESSDDEVDPVANSCLEQSRRGEAVPWPQGRDLIDGSLIRARLAPRAWFTVTDVARALQNVPTWWKPSGSAGRDARVLLEWWLDEGSVERQHFGPSLRPFFRFV